MDFTSTRSETSLHAISKTKPEKMEKKLVLGLIFAHFFKKHLALPVIRYHVPRSSYTISEKTNDPILRKLSDGWTDRQKDKQTDQGPRLIS